MRIVKYIGLGIFVVAVLTGVYFFLVKGYRTGTGLTPTVSPTPSGTVAPSPATGDVFSDKISLDIISPENGSLLTSTQIVVKGKTAPGAEVFVNDQSAKADAKGNFAVDITLEEGQNTIIVAANDSLGNATQKEITVTVKSFN